VTRNKLSFRDDLPKLLLDSEPLERNLDRKFREWLSRCHSELDRSITYEKALPAAEQAAARKVHGEGHTVFERCLGALPQDRAVAVRRGDVLWLRVGKGTNGQICGRVAGFLVPQATKSDGSYPGGRVLVTRLPELIHGQLPASYPVGRILSACLEAEEAEAVGKEVAKAPARVKLEEPIQFFSSQVVLSAGDAVPEISARVFTSSGQAVTRTVLAGQKVTLTLVQTLVYLGPEGKESADDPTDPADPSLGHSGGSGAARGGSPGGGGGEEEEEPAGAAENGRGRGKRAAGKRKSANAREPELRDVSNLQGGVADGDGAEPTEGAAKPRKKAKGASAGAAAGDAEALAEAEADEAAATAAQRKGKGKSKKAALLAAAAQASAEQAAADARHVVTQVSGNTPFGSPRSNPLSLSCTP
jgi:hypothetical protein